MKPYGIVSDCHLHEWSPFSKIDAAGLNSRLQHIIYGIAEAGSNALAHGGDTLYITGDLFHVRGSVSPAVLNSAITLFEKLTLSGIQVRILAGNHDLSSRDSNALSNACEALRTISGVKVISETTNFVDDKVVMVPWFDSMDRVREEIKDQIAFLAAAGDDMAEWTLMLHVPVNGVIAGLPDHGFYAKELEMLGFARVFSGHYHNHKAFPGEVYSVGATTHQTWNDIGTKAGHLIVSDTGVQFVESTSPKFVEYNIAWDDDETIAQCEGNYVRVRLGAATDDEVTLIRDHLEGCGALGTLVQCIPTPKTAASARATTVTSAMTVRESTEQWIDANSAGTAGLKELCAKIMDEVEAVDA